MAESRQERGDESRLQGVERGVGGEILLVGEKLAVEAGYGVGFLLEIAERVVFNLDGRGGVVLKDASGESDVADGVKSGEEEDIAQSFLVEGEVLGQGLAEDEHSVVGVDERGVGGEAAAQVHIAQHRVESGKVHIFNLGSQALAGALGVFPVQHNLALLVLDAQIVDLDAALLEMDFVLVVEKPRQVVKVEFGVAQIEPDVIGVGHVHPSRKFGMMAPVVVEVVEPAEVISDGVASGVGIQVDVAEGKTLGAHDGHGGVAVQRQVKFSGASAVAIEVETVGGELVAQPQEGNVRLNLVVVVKRRQVNVNGGVGRDEEVGHQQPCEMPGAVGVHTEPDVSVVRNLVGNLRCGFGGRNEGGEVGVCDVLQRVLDAGHGVAGLQRGADNAGGEDVLVRPLVVDGGEAKTVVDDAVGAVVDADVVASCVAVHIVEVGAAQGHREIVKPETEVRVFLEGADDFVESLGGGGVETRHSGGDGAGVKVGQGDAALQGGRLLREVQLGDAGEMGLQSLETLFVEGGGS